MSLSHLKQRGTLYHWRRRVPEHLAARLGMREISRALGTGSLRLARIRARRLSAAADYLFDLITRMPDLDPPKIAELARHCAGLPRALETGPRR